MKAYPLIPALALTVLAVSGCGKNISAAGVAEAVQSTEIQRKWTQTSCDQPGALKLIGASKRTSYTFAGNEITRSDAYYSDTTCGAGAVNVTYTGTFDKKDLAAQPDVNQLDVTLYKVFVVGQNAEGIKLLNAANFCGKKNWVENVEADLSANSRDAFCPLENLPQTYYTVYAVRNDYLFLGDAEAKPEDRSVKLNLEMPYGKAQ